MKVTQASEAGLELAFETLWYSSHFHEEIFSLHAP